MVFQQPPIFYQRKLYALLQVLIQVPKPDRFSCLQPDLPELQAWWQQHGKQTIDIARASDRLTFQSNLTQPTVNETPAAIEVRHLISGELQQVAGSQPEVPIPDALLNESNPQTVLLWLWRFHPELQVEQQRDALLYPTEQSMPDCPYHSYTSTVSALTGALFPADWQASAPHHPQPYLLLFTFSPVQDFIKASRKFLDFWAGSYLLHYLSAYLCWYVAQNYGADAVITPSLWGQEIIDAMILQDHPDWRAFFASIQDGQDPITRFNDRTSTSLSTAGFPNTITLLAGSKEQALEIGKALSQQLQQEWKNIADQVREHIKQQVIQTVPDAFQQLDIEQIEQLSIAKINEYLSIPKNGLVEAANQASKLEAQAVGISDDIRSFWQRLEIQLSAKEHPAPYLRELKHYKQPGCWEWNKLWQAQIEQSWEPYYVAVPLGHPHANNPLHISTNDSNLEDWLKAQNNLIRVRQNADGAYLFPSHAEKTAYPSLNVGTWWGSYQAKLGQLIQSVKNTRNWKIPVAPGERSSLSGQYSAVHPRFRYEKFQNGRGMSAGSMRLFWRLMAEAYPGLFNGSEKLNAIELTKRMAWMHGGIAEKLGIDTTEIKRKVELRRQHQQTVNINQSIQILYERLIRFPNLSSIAAARFMQDDHSGQTESYWDCLSQLIKCDLPNYHRQFKRLTRFRPSQIHQVDQKFNPNNRFRQNYNGVMFSSKWLGDDLNLKGNELTVLRECIAQAHKESGFGDSSPSDWWVLVLGDGDGMGKYVSGGKLKPYRDYLRADFVDRSQCSPEVQNLSEEVWRDLIEHTKKRMGPATHIGLNRALLDFSNRLVPYLTEQRFCGRVIYSGGDDVMVALPLADLPQFLRSLRAAWSGTADPETDDRIRFQHKGGYWHPPETPLEGIPNRPLFTMGADATMSLGIVIAHKSVPLPTVLEKLWEAEKDRAKKMLGYSDSETKKDKDGLCFRVIYGSGNTLEALMKGDLLENWWQWVSSYEQQTSLSPLLYRLAEVLPNHADATSDTPPLDLVAKVVIENRDEQLPDQVKSMLLAWIKQWETWAWSAQQTRQNRLRQTENLSDELAAKQAKQTLGTRPEDLSNLLRFTAFWVSRRQEELSWQPSETVAATGGNS